MTIPFRIDSVVLSTTGGDVVHEFQSDLTLIAGPTGVGKTSLLELIKFALGGSGKLSPVVRRDVTEISLDLTIAKSRLRVRRRLDGRNRKTVRVWDLSKNERLSDHHIGDDQTPTLNSLLMSQLGFPDNMRAAARGGSSTRAGATISFNDVYSFLYVPQYDINRDIAKSADSYINPKRQALFEFLFGLTDPELLAKRSRINTLKAEIEASQAEHGTILTFMNESGTVSRIEAQQGLNTAVREEQGAEEQKRALTDELDPVIDRETLLLRDLLADSELSYAEAKSTYQAASREKREYEEQRRRVDRDRQKLKRLHDAGTRLANIEFSLCPRCMQTVAERETPVGVCRLCLLPEQVAEASQLDHAGTYEMHQLAAQAAEIEDQIILLEAQLEESADAVSKREELVTNLSELIDRRSRSRIAPRLQAYGDAVETVAVARTRQEQFDLVLRQWQRADELGERAEQLTAERERLKGEVSTATARQGAKREELLAELNQKFEAAVLSLGIPGVESASINPDNYLPMLNGERFQDYSSGGGAITATQVAYWTSVLRVALNAKDSRYPAFLMMDSPQLALNTSEYIAAAIYRHLKALSDEYSGRLQLIIADNEIPDPYKTEFSELSFTYDHPTVHTVPHPGPASVRTISINDEDAG